MIKKFKFCPLCKTLLKKAKIEGRQRLACTKCGWVHYENPVPVVVCAAKNKQGKIFIAKRNFEPGINKWALPGGFVESCETPEKACLRELKEETGLMGQISRLLGVYERQSKKYGNLLIIGYEVKVKHENILTNNEIRDGKFVTHKEIPHIPFLAHRKIIEETFNPSLIA